MWDAERAGASSAGDDGLLRTMRGHVGRVGAAAWSSHLVASGSRDRTILLRDVRAPGGEERLDAGYPESDPCVAARWDLHRSEVCGLRWSPDDRQLASGGNDNTAHVWEPGSRRPVHTVTSHRGAVKALAWSPHQRGLLATGGGTADRSIRFHSIPAGAELGGLDTGSQVCGLLWSRTTDELVSTHGFSRNSVTVWRHLPGHPVGCARLATLLAHDMRVLYLAASPDGRTVVTGSGDETLRFWSVFPGERGERGGGVGGGGGGLLRHVQVRC